jgi:hypothetical protein
MFTVSVSNSNAAMINTTVVDMQGQVVYTGSFNSAGANALQVDLRSLAKGVYYIRIDAGNSSATKRVIIQ